MVRPQVEADLQFRDVPVGLDSRSRVSLHGQARVLARHDRSIVNHVTLNFRKSGRLRKFPSKTVSTTIEKTEHKTKAVGSGELRSGEWGVGSGEWGVGSGAWCVVRGAWGMGREDWQGQSCRRLPPVLRGKLAK